MISPHSAPGRRSYAWMLLALTPLWLIGMFDRGLWTPDEPREADMAWRMQQQSDRTLPQLAGTPFLEKPPLSYWASAAAQTLFGNSPAAARAPNLLYAVIGALAIMALAHALGAQGLAAAMAALLAGSALTSWRVAIWLAPDAGLMAGCAVALLGAWRGYQAPPGAAKARGYALMHLGAALGFMAKSAPGWLAPGLALLVLIAWERRWSELKRWELYAGFALQALLIGPWLLAVAYGEHGGAALRTLFWNNLVGRFTPLSAPAQLDYTSGHHNTPGKYLLELPVYLLPWTLLVAAALRRAWRRARDTDRAASAWRFALAASLPFLVVLSVAATARDIYAAPALPGLALLVSLWLQETPATSGRFERLALSGTRALTGLVALLIAGALVLLVAAGAIASAAGVVAVLLIIGAAGALLVRAGHAQRAGDAQHSLVWSYAAYATALCLGCALAFPVVDRWQDLPRLARSIEADNAQHSLALLDPDETTIAMLDHTRPGGFAILRSNGRVPEATVSAWFQERGAAGRVLVLLPGHAPGDLTQLIARYRPVSAADDGTAGELTAAGAARIERRYQLPQGRRYALLGPPPAP